MKKTLRIYMPHGAKIKQPLTFWQRLWNPSLSSFLLKKAKEDGLEHAIFLNVSAT